MPAYVVACVSWNDPEAARRYGEMVIESLEPVGGRYLVRGPVDAVVEGDAAPARLAVVEFPSLDAARQWYDSQAYQPARTIRAASALTHWLVFIDGSS